MKICLLMVVLAACSKGKSDSGKCAEIAAGAVDRMMGSVAAAPGLPDDQKAQMKAKGEALKGVIAKRCTEDSWSAEVVECYSKAGSMPDIRACRSKLPEAQSKQLQTEELQVMMGGGGMMPRANPEELQKRLDALGADLEKAQQDLTAATDDATRTAAKERVVQLQKQQFMLKQQIEHMKGAGGPPGAVPVPAPGGAPAPAPGGAPAPAPAAGSGSAAATPAKP